jgi:sulfatase maturation enzyme AslB (radical SAM superfamily)
MKDARLKMLDDKPVSWCSQCYTQEASGAESLRITKNRDFSNYEHRKELTNTDGSLDEVYMGYMDIRFSNLCNMKCRMCGPELSSNWHADSIALGQLDKSTPKVINIDTNSVDDISSMMDTWLTQVEEIYWAGGEPLIIDEHYTALQKLIEYKRTDVRLLYNTNFSKLTHKGNDVLDYWKQFSTVNVGASLDAEGPRAEYMRSGTKWDKIVANRHRMMAETPNHDFWISSTVTALNAYHVIDFFESWVSQGLVSPEKLDINVIFNPIEMRIQLLPAAMKREIQDKAANFLNKHNIRTDTRTYMAFTGFIQRLNEDEEHLQPMFYQSMKRMDDLRNENLLTVFPELDFLKKYQQL